SERIGIRQQENEITIPAFLLNENHRTVAFLNAANELVVSASRAAPAQMANLDVQPGRWQIEADATAPLRVRCLKSLQPGATDTRAEAGRMLLDAQLPAIVQLSPGGSIAIEILPESEGTVEIKQLRLKRGE